MKNYRKIFIYVLLFLFLNISIFSQVSASENIIQSLSKESFPEADDVEPKVSSKKDDAVVSGGIEIINDINLSECIRLALGNNPDIQAALQDIFASDRRIKQVWSAYFPQFSWQSGYTKIRQLQLSDVLGRNLIYNFYVLGQISASQMLYDFGVTQNRATISKLENQAYKIMLTGTVNTVVCNVKKAYYYMQYALEAKRVAEEMVDKYEAFYKQAKAFYQAGTVPKVDVTIAEVNLSNSKLLLIQAENALEVSMAQLSNAMGLPYESKYKISDNLRYLPCEITLDNAVKIAQESRPEFKIADVRVEMALQNIKLLQKSYFPKLTVEGQYQYGGATPTSDYGYNYGGYLTFPTINAMLINNQIKEARALHSKQQALSRSTKNNIYYEIQQAFYLMTEKKNSIPVAFLGLKKAKENYELSYGRYKVGVGNPVELREAQVQYQEAMLKYYNSLYQFNSAKAELEQYIGRNLSENEVELNIKEETMFKKSKKKKS